MSKTPIRPEAQHNVSVFLRYQQKREAQIYSNVKEPVFDPPPQATQRWLCPGCDQHHIEQPVDMDYYRCSCGWKGDRKTLLTTL